MPLLLGIHPCLVVDVLLFTRPTTAEFHGEPIIMISLLLVKHRPVRGVSLDIPCMEP